MRPPFRPDGMQKLTERIDIPCSEELRDRLITLSALMRKPKAELARELLTVQIEGMYALIEANVSWPIGKGDGND